MNPVTVIRGNGPIILGQPHSGTYVPEDIFTNLNDLGRQLIDTDWYIPTLYDGLIDDVTVVRANFSRYVIDPNRGPNGVSLYPGGNTTDLVPFNSFDGEQIWQSPPSQQEIADRLKIFHDAYHAAMEDEISRVKKSYGFVVLYDCHSIRSEIPYLFDKQLPDLNIGDNSGTTCSDKIISAIEQVCSQNSKYSFVFNGRFKGGWTTRHYGRPEDGVHAIQMELAQRAYLKTEQAPFAYDTIKAAQLREVLQNIFQEIQNQLKVNF